MLFVCSPPPPRTRVAKHRSLGGATWEREVQAGIRDIRPPMPAGDTVLIGRDSEGIGAVAWWFQMFGPSTVKIQAVAVALRLRGDGRRCGDELMDHALDRIAGDADAAAEDKVIVYAHIRPENGASQALFDRFGFFYVNDTDSGLQRWVLRIDFER